jgi:hypothetical protein
MLVEYTGARYYLLNALKSAPDIFGFLIDGLTEEAVDFRADAARFSIREVMAHLAE